MLRGWRRSGLGALALLAAAGCGDDTTGSGGGGGADGATTGAATTSAATTSAATTGAATTSSSGDGGGTGQGGDGGSTTSAQGGGQTTGQGGAGGTGGAGGGGGSTPGCTEITIDEDGVVARGPFRLGTTFTPTLGDADTLDALGLQYTAEEGDFDLTSVFNDNFATCEQCVSVFEDTDGTVDGTARHYFQTGGTMSVAEGSVFPFATLTLTDVTLVEVTLDEDSISTPVPGGACLTVANAEVVFDVPDAWTCEPFTYGNGNNCNCNCGAPDPDCALDLALIVGCGPDHLPSDAGATCSTDGECVAPVDWTCAPALFNDGETCDCDCGVQDADCASFLGLPVEGCIDAGAVCRGGACVIIPDAWTCNESYYASNDGCDCVCGVYDPDCDNGGGAIGCEPGEGCTAEGLCGFPATWTCGDATWDDGANCDCECGALDPDCNLGGATVVGCEVDEICAAGTCAAQAENDLCADALALTEGTVNGSWVGSTSQLDPTMAGCTGFPAIGADVFYSVSLADGEVLTVSINQVGSVADSALYLLTDCANAGSCVEGVDTPPNQPEQLVYTANGDQDLFLVVDQYGSTDQVTFQLTVTIN